MPMKEYYHVLLPTIFKILSISQLANKQGVFVGRNSFDRQKMFPGMDLEKNQIPAITSLPYHTNGMQLHPTKRVRIVSSIWHLAEASNP